MGLFSKSKSKSPQPSFQSGPPAYSATPSSNYAPPSPPREPVNPDTRPLPNGWISQYDPNSRKFFYVYTPTALRQWEHPADKPIGNSTSNRGENASYAAPSQQQQQPFYPQQQQQRIFPQQPQYVQQPQYMQQPQYIQQPQYGRASGGGMGVGKMAAAGVGGGLLGYMIGDAMFDQPDTIVENNYYGDDTGNFDAGGGDFGGFDDF
ncbi:hypothetical protein MAM1_0290c09301 [Mucor ambiguus]|uniref:WW domain-containing protein n=1 Tax=Mucor ambiguus TaxID=91626 RepID=A0A0C9MQS5_9FUNG|nr:hypothetical protein MAM1_0290c09301 [Mucor ambiguus]